MRTTLLVLVTLVPLPAFAQTGFADLVDHIHLAAPDQPKAVEWYRAHFGAEPTPEGPDRAMLGTTRLIFQKSEMPKPSTGSILGAIGFSVSDLDGAIKKLQADGVKMVMPPMVMPLQLMRWCASASASAAVKQPRTQRELVASAPMVREALSR